MILMIGGAYQGKKDLALQMADGREELVFPDVQEYIREKISEGQSPDKIEETLTAEAFRLPGRILTADEIGNGIVPMEAFDREYRELTGRLLCRLAKEAETVYRVIAGIPIKIKG